MARVLKNTDATITQTFYVSGTATDVGSVTVTITRLDGTAVATDDSTTNNTDGTYDYTLSDTVTSRLDLMRFEWTATGTNQTLTSFVEVVGAHILTESQFRSFDTAHSNTSKYPDSAILRERDQVTDLLEEWTGRSWVPRFRLAKWNGAGSHTVYVADSRQSRGGSDGAGANLDIQSVVSATNNGTAVTPSTIDVIDGGFVRQSGVWANRTRSSAYPVVIGWEYGAETVRDGVDRIANLLMRERLTRGPVSDAAISVASEFGTSQFILEGGPMRNVSRIPEVNAWVQAHWSKSPLVI